MIVGWRGAVFGEDYVLEFCGGAYSGVWWGRPGWWWRQIESIYGLYLQSVTRYLRVALVFAWNSALHDGFHFYFSGVLLGLA